MASNGIITEDTVPYTVLQTILRQRGVEEDFLNDIVDTKHDHCEVRSRNIQIYITTYGYYINLKKELNDPFFWDEHMDTDINLYNFDCLSVLEDYMGEQDFRDFLNSYHGHNLNIWIVDPKKKNRKENIKKLVADYIAGEKSYRKLAEEYGVSESCVRQWVHRYKD